MVQAHLESGLGYPHLKMDDRIVDPQRESSARAYIALSRYTVELTEIAHQSLGREVAGNRDVLIALTLSWKGPLTLSDLREATGSPRVSVSRALKRLEAAGLASRGRDSRDGRSFAVSLTPNGRRRVAALLSRLADYYVSAEPLLKEAFDLLDVGPADDASRTTEVVGISAAIAEAGAAWVSAADQALTPLGVRDFAGRVTLALIHVYGTARPTQIADELRLSPSGTSAVLGRLEGAGLITRRHDLTPGDRRVVVVELTPLGQQAAHMQLDLFAAHAEALAAALWPTVRSAPNLSR